MANFIKNVVTTAIVMVVASAATVIGKNAGTSVWQNGLGNKVDQKSRKIFTKKTDEN